MIKAILTFFAVLGFILAPNLGSASCRDLLSDHETLSVSEDFDAAFRELAIMAIQNDTVSLQDAAGASGLLIDEFNRKRREFLDLGVRDNLFTAEEFEARLKQEVELLQSQMSAESSVTFQRDQTLKRVNLGAEAVFGTIEPGSFSMGREGAEVPVEISRAFGIMITPVTEFIWSRVAKLAFANLEASGYYQRHLRPTLEHEGVSDSFAKTGVSYDDVEAWLGALNELALSDRYLAELKMIFPQHQTGDSYSLPSEAQWEFVARNRGTLKGNHPISDEEMNRIACHSDKSPPRAQDQPMICEKAPFLVGDVGIYDLFGGVQEMVNDLVFSLKDPLKGGLDPFSFPLGATIVPVRGGYWRSATRTSLSPSARAGIPRDLPSTFTGFRLVKKIK